ncbi:hypothetical protein LQ939_13065 [Pantoea alhagi]|uniref:hypothetical protein n=1 Tax=Pantoea alhagi TaxID=1891675 RepID=UPI00202B0D5C|nr:hypothetical protein [Pantoea alhagi]URQ59699.1 hypothetical protein LQ939_13065 [Pantoea alhagi]
MKYRIGLTLILTLLSLSAHSSGTIMFHGGLEEPGCNIAVAQGTLSSECYRQGQWLRQSQPLAHLTRSDLAEQSVQTQLVWLDNQQQRGLIIVSYQ